ncbi:hypothetical protein BJF86_03980 [Serinicoccus sp. CNJ-927]|uniref:MFS transporter n=1 Tax=Serinicoccus sp. CNJ-927 TaxID=1904970 RepID=UPI0009601ADB|nr:MFS transporter [Serinicoccus sp. CNJ-927]OLT40982.1 hypothetical protein BJF86_03980 [Serinicoccus sp. CNJ-927]
MLLAAWSVSAFVLEIPSGAWADLLDRRRMLLASGLVYVSAFAVWMVWPTFWGFLLGFLLWSCSDALHSGTWEAYLFDQLTAQGHAVRYAHVKARSERIVLLVMAGAIAAAAPLHQVGGYPLVGAASLAAALLHVGVTLRLPRPGRPGIPATAERLTSPPPDVAPRRGPGARPGSRCCARRLGGDPAGGPGPWRWAWGTPRRAASTWPVTAACSTRSGRTARCARR